MSVGLFCMVLIHIGAVQIDLNDAERYVHTGSITNS